MTKDLLGQVLEGEPPAFALLHRPMTAGAGELDVLVGEVSTPPTLAQVPLARSQAPWVAGGQEVLVVIPYRQIGERGFACADDGAPLLAMAVTDQARVPLPTAMARIADAPIRLRGGHFDVDDETYSATAHTIITREIGQGAGANFVLKRTFVADVSDDGPHSALAFFRRLLRRESGAYWTFLIHTGDRTLVGASPERHISVHRGTAVMNPISGTYRYPPTGPTLRGVLNFLADRKEADELYMVVDEELKMMARVCESGGRVSGPYLKQMGHLAHTEYLLAGHTAQDPRRVLRDTLFAPTVTGSPLENACRVIDRYEPHGRGYYSGVAALIGRDRHGGRTLDSAILIRTADISAGGRLRIGVGATLVRHSDPADEAAETRAKAAGLLSALESAHPGQARGRTARPARLASHPRVRAALRQRNHHIAAFWQAEDEVRHRPDPVLAGRRVLVVDAEDTFTSMLGHQLRVLGLQVAVRRFDQSCAFDTYDLTVLGPGPGDPRATGHTKIARLHSAVQALLAQRRPFLAVCLSHQVLCAHLGLDLLRRKAPNQGIQREIDLFGVRETVGFYNTFVAVSPEDTMVHPGVGRVEISRDRRTGQVDALRGPGFASLQFHPESLLTQDGPRIVATLLGALLAKPPHREEANT
ncbi:phenazine-specific anthranilate synthase [Streptomyces sp. NA02950]|uniref:anthranilate synthase family protein n=1 Tax=Streptomyces sp. NA02950 TaxID=2742137 RepID=UPI00158FD3AA|nr:anthranilate synthase family protein [Streptomyces sp. NA02950]QKV97003.1 phenazine-specific anthranilate synthase [Streptomyces sp. NA02950]